MQRNSGFTLLEMAIVITVIALIIGGIMLGDNLARNAQINSVTGEMSNHISAIKTFQDKYQAMPGDFAQATTYWSSATNGDGDGHISNIEGFDAWQHLALAGMVEGTYTGATGPGGHLDKIPGVNIPKSQLSGAGWGLIYIDDVDSSYMLYSAGDILPRHVLWFGGRSIYGNTNQQELVFTAQEAELLDTKIDDGMPALGKVAAQDNTPPSGSTVQCQSLSGGADESSYNLSASGKICALVFKTGL